MISYKYMIYISPRKIYIIFYIIFNKTKKK